jgi:hypothetical protein
MYLTNEPCGPSQTTQIANKDTTYTRSNYLGPNVEVANAFQADWKFLLRPFSLWRVNWGK